MIGHPGNLAMPNPESKVPKAVLRKAAPTLGWGATMDG